MFTIIGNRGMEPFVRLVLNDEIECKKMLDSRISGVVKPF